MKFFNFQLEWEKFKHCWNHPQVQQTINFKLNQFRVFHYGEEYNLDPQYWKINPVKLQNAIMHQTSITHSTRQLFYHQHNRAFGYNKHSLFDKVVLTELQKQKLPVNDSLDAFYMPNGHNFFVEAMYITACIMFPGNEIYLAHGYTDNTTIRDIRTDRYFVIDRTRKEIFDFHAYYDFTRLNKKQYDPNSIIDVIDNKRLRIYNSIKMYNTNKNKFKKWLFSEQPSTIFLITSLETIWVELSFENALHDRMYNTAKKQYLIEIFDCY